MHCAGVYLPMGVYLPRVVYLLGGVPVQGVYCRGMYLLGGVPAGVVYLPGAVSQHAMGQAPPVNRMTETGVKT